MFGGLTHMRLMLKLLVIYIVRSVSVCRASTVSVRVYVRVLLHLLRVSRTLFRTMFKSLKILI